MNGTTGSNVGGLIGEHDPSQAATIANVSASGSVSTSGGVRVGGLVGSSISGSPVAVSDARADGNVTTSDLSGTIALTGGLIGEIQNAKNVTNVSATGQVNASIVPGQVVSGNVGGLIGSLEHESSSRVVANASATGDVATDTNGRVGGLIGSYSGGGTVQDSSARGTVSATGQSVGGLLGLADATTIRRSSATGDVNSTENNVGGLIGKHDPSQAATIANVSASGNVSTSNGRVGGLVGSMGQTRPVSVSDASASGDVTAAVGSGRGYVGGLIGLIRNTKNVTNVSATGRVNVSANVGTNGQGVGGLIGQIAPKSGANLVANASATGDVNADAAGPIGGLIGGHRAGVVQDSYAQGNVSGRSKVGGLIGTSSGDTSRVYASGQAKLGGNSVGGLIGTTVIKDFQNRFVESGTLSESYWDRGATNQSSPTGSRAEDVDNTVGYGAVGDTTDAAEMQGQAATEFMDGLDYTTTWQTTSEYPILQAQASGNEQPPRTVDTVSSTNLTAVQGEQVSISVTVTAVNASADGFLVSVQDTGNITALDNATATTNQTGTATFTFNESAAGTFEPRFSVAGDSAVSTNATVTIEEGEVRTYTREDNKELTAVYSGNGTVDNPYLIDSLADLQAINKDATTLSANYQLATDINASATNKSWNGGDGFEPIATFTGTLDGDGNAVTDLYIDRGDQTDVGLFGTTGSDSTVSNVTLITPNVTGGKNTGPLVGAHSGSMNRVFVAGGTATTTASGEAHLGGLAGVLLEGGTTITESHTSATVKANGGDEVGGFAGDLGNNGRVEQVYATGGVQNGGNSIGGLFGDANSGSQIIEAFAAGNVSGSSNVGGLIGRSSATVERAYWDEQSTGQLDSAGGSEIGLPTIKMQGRAATEFMPGLNYTTTWQTTSEYPILQAQAGGDEQPPRTVETVSSTDVSAVHGRAGLDFSHRDDCQCQ